MYLHMKWGVVLVGWVGGAPGQERRKRWAYCCRGPDPLSPKSRDTKDLKPPDGGGGVGVEN